MAHEHSRFVWTVNVPDPPAAAMEEGVTLRSTAQRAETGDGARAVVEPELHAEAAPQTSNRSTKARNSKGFMRALPLPQADYVPSLDAYFSGVANFSMRN
jgi:hypothetical protein